MVTRYDVIRSRWSSHFCVKTHVFSTSFNNKSKMKQSAYLCVILCQITEKLLFLVAISKIAAKMVTIVGDATDFSRAAHA